MSVNIKIKILCISFIMFPTNLYAKIKYEYNNYDDRNTGMNSQMQPLESALTPLSYIKFCMNWAEQCQAGSSQDLIPFDQSTMTKLEQINVQVNRSIRPQQRAAETSIDVWQINPTNGDCNDYAVSKRHALIQQGFPRGALLLASAMTSWGEAHLVLVVRTSQGDYVLDNLRSRVQLWDKTGYRWLNRESASNPMHWERIAKPTKNIQTVSRIRKNPDIAQTYKPSLDHSYPLHEDRLTPQLSPIFVDHQLRDFVPRAIKVSHKQAPVSVVDFSLTR